MGLVVDVVGKPYMEDDMYTVTLHFEDLDTLLVELIGAHLVEVVSPFPREVGWEINTARYALLLKYNEATIVEGE